METIMVVFSATSISKKIARFAIDRAVGHNRRNCCSALGWTSGVRSSVRCRAIGPVDILGGLVLVSVPLSAGELLARAAYCAGGSGGGIESGVAGTTTEVRLGRTCMTYPDSSN